MNVIAKWHDIEQNSIEWEELRVGKITSSNLKVIMANLGKPFGDPAKKYALKLALERIKGCKSENNYSNAHMERGHEQEPIARMMYEDLHFTEVTNGGFFDCGYFGDSPDGLVDEDGVIEIKSVIDTVHYANIKRGKFDPAYKWQIVGHLECSNRDWCDFVSYCADYPEGKQLFVNRIYRKDVENDIKQLRERRIEFNNLIEQIIVEINEID